MDKVFFDGRHMKGFNIPVSFDSDIGWDVYGEMNIPEDKMLPYVAAAHRALELNAQAVASIPFAIVDNRGKDVLSSEDWHESDHALTKEIPDPAGLIKKIEKSKGMRNVAYLLLDRRDPVRYLVPDSITLDVSPEHGIKGYWRKTGARQVYYPVSSNLILALINTDWDEEVVPSKNTDFRSIMQSIGIVYKSDYYVSDFFGRGGIKPSLLQVKGMPQSDEKTRIQEWFDSLMLGLTKVRSRVVNADMMDVKPLGTGVDDFKDNSFYKQAIENISVGNGIPIDLLMSNSANFATARVHNNQWYDNKVVPDAKWVARQLTTLYFSRFDLRMDIRENVTAVDTEDESRKATAFSTIASTLSKSKHPKANSIAAQIVGLDLPQGMRYEDLDERDESLTEEKPQTEPMPEEMDDEMEQVKFVPNADQLNELGTWQDIATRKIKKGQKLELPLTAKYLPDEVAENINAKLAVVTDIAGVKAAFDLTTTSVPQYQGGELLVLAEALNRLASTETKTLPQNYTFNMPAITVNTPEQSVTVKPELKTDAPIVNVSVPEIPAPIVNVTNEVQTPSVTVNNDVRPSDVVVKEAKQKGAKVVRDREGRITGIDPK